MDEHENLLHVRFAEEVMGRTEIEPSREGGALKLYGVVWTNRGPRRREVPDYSNDLGAMWAAEQHLGRLGLAREYVTALARVTGASDLGDPEQLFRLVSASPAQRCEAGLEAHRGARSGSSDPGGAPPAARLTDAFSP